MTLKDTTLEAFGQLTASLRGAFEAASLRRNDEPLRLAASALKKLVLQPASPPLGPNPPARWKATPTTNVPPAGGVYTIVAVVGHEQAGERGLTTPRVKDGITQTHKDRKEQLLRTAYLSAARGDADVVNHAARRVVESQGKVQ